MRTYSLKHISLTVITLLAVTGGYAQNLTEAAIAAKVKQTLQKLTLEEKIAMLHANGIFTSAGVPRLGIPDLSTDDGPLGVREDVKPGWASANLTTDSATFFPNGSALAATWNPVLANRFGIAMGEEAKERKKDVMLAPAFNICRTPLGGRTYEYYSEDPFLNASLAVATVKGIQSQHVAACVKHYAVNNQEFQRSNVSVDISERALREIYLPAFKASIEEGNAWTIMAAYNKLRGQWCSENTYLLNDILKGEWHFKGLVMSDWGGTHSTIDAANNGLDLEMGSRTPYETNHFGNPLIDAIKADKVSLKTIDDKVSRILWVMYHTSLSTNSPKGSINTPGHSKTVYDVATESIVLLKNSKNLLPLNIAKYKSIAIIGDNATKTFHLGGFGAGVKAKYEIIALQGLKNKIGSKVDLKFAQGYKGDYKYNSTPQVKEAASKPNPELIQQAVETAKSSDLAIVFIGGNRDYESEGSDRKTLELPFAEQAVVDAVTEANPNTIVVVVGGAPYDIGKIKNNNHTIVWSWYNGSEGGNALADVLTGKVNPSGKLPFTFPATIDDSPAHALHAYPGENNKVEYKEGILVGYRWFDTKKIEPMYCFGYGLSYTDYKYAGLHTNKKDYKPADKITATIKVKNTGKYAGKETVQLYIGKEGSTVERAEKELKAFKKVFIPAGQEVTVTLNLDAKDLAYFDEKTMKWVVEPGNYKLLAGTSSKDIKETTVIKID
ncbi:MAG TPA: glycoside hydrolase family 3 C-terminal domain-containing protein [Mucilaginibacter sp.]